MIQAAHKHLIDTSSCRENEDEDSVITGSQATLADHMDSFPLIPLPVIAQLNIRDLEHVERELRNLLDSLTPHEGKQLGTYATRQLALVQHHMTHQRAQERVCQLIRGDVNVALAPLTANTLKKSSSAAVVTIPPFPSFPSTLMEEATKRSQVKFCPEIEAATVRWNDKKAAAQMARTMIQRNATRGVVSITERSFMISAGENASKKRRRPRVVKRSAEEEARDRTQQVERERELRRQAACQRLQARRDLQAKRKEENKHKPRETRMKEEECEKQLGSSDSDEASEESDVSNCSESDEANEEAILALKVQVSSSIEGQDNDNHTDRSESGSDSARKDGGESQEETVSEVFECDVDRNCGLDIEPERVVTKTETTAYGVEEKEGFCGDTTCLKERIENQQQDALDASFAVDLQKLMTLRAAAKLEQLQVEKEAKGLPVTALPDSPPPDSTPSIEERPSAKVWLKSLSCDDLKGFKCEENTLKEGTTATESATIKNETLWVEVGRESRKVESCGNRLVLPRTPVVECIDYGFYFRNFSCILTSVYAQSRKAASVSYRPLSGTGDHTMRLQQKMYESWQSIMHDYATVFGPKIVVPEEMVPLAAAKPWTPHYRINSTARKEVSEIVTQALDRLGGGWEDHPAGLGLKTTWNLLWTWSKPRVERLALLVWQKVNHFQHAKALTRKDCLKRLIGKYQAADKRLRHVFDIIPLTFLLPKEYVRFVHAFQERSAHLKRRGRSEDSNIWIMKPVALSRGRGISLVNDLSHVIYGDQVVIQEYIAAPRLLDGYKFDLRLYVLVTSFNPLEAFIYDEGFVRLCTRPYQDNDISNLFVHLTNSSLQKDNSTVNTGRANRVTLQEAIRKECDVAEEAETGGTKTSLAYLWKRLAAEGVNVEEVKRRIDEVVLKALLCGEDQIPFQINSFDLFGYDILLDSDLRPWLIEINSSPSMAREHHLDYRVKDAMMLDTLGVVDPLHFDRAKLAEVIARRQRDEEDEKKRPHAYTRHPREVEELAAHQLNQDLTAILRGKVPRMYGELPERLGNYRRLCPHTTMYNQLVKLKRSGTCQA